MEDVMTRRYKNIASQIRKDFENNFIEQELLKKLYCKYNYIEEIDSFIKQANKMFPRLNCGIASVYLQYVFKKGKVVNGTYDEENHTFLLLEDKTIVDITADQYGGPSVYVGPIEKFWSIKS